ncbi:lipoprotein [Mycolicibacterium canariasense]|uniref:Lipoprotein n=1 Tax=Mycolicibacterium canariasense TaxID=228230 RepID=A0A100WEX3_MYCCR|nr:DUF305 domain-containing protein [Mycolicibacterium canariasense]MCV7211186.1 DUF305 domain-containing protein [Mycolicibacterium canariasense]ORV03254.1 DUF305 domain-containing protein [Mycolicibacterium canariasense]GAS97244.1 lipoprotein [Mycolicibacterium canariasense]
MKRTVLAGAAAVAAVTLAACSNSTPAAGPSPAATSTSASAPTSAPTSAVPSAAAHNHADVMFAQMMIPHHQQAIEMSDMILGKQGIDPKVTDLATQIKAAQGPEIDQMKGWLSQWGTPAMAPSSSMPGMGMPGMDMPGMGMHGEGMMSEQDMTALQNAQGIAASKLFLTQMIAHHQGAITMAENEIRTGQFPDAVALANNIKTSQQREIETMRSILATL